MALEHETMEVSEMAAMGGRARAAKLTPERRSEIARDAIRTRWAKKALTNEADLGQAS